MDEGLSKTLTLAFAKSSFLPRRYADSEAAYNKLSPARMDAPVHWPNTMQIATGESTGCDAPSS